MVIFGERFYNNTPIGKYVTFEEILSYSLTSDGSVGVVKLNSNNVNLSIQSTGQNVIIHTISVGANAVTTAKVKEIQNMGVELYNKQPWLNKLISEGYELLFSKEGALISGYRQRDTKYLGLQELIALSVVDHARCALMVFKSWESMAVEVISALSSTDDKVCLYMFGKPPVNIGTYSISALMIGLLDPIQKVCFAAIPKDKHNLSEALFWYYMIVNGYNEFPEGLELPVDAMHRMIDGIK